MKSHVRSCHAYSSAKEGSLGTAWQVQVQDDGTLTKTDRVDLIPPYLRLLLSDFFEMGIFLLLMLLFTGVCRLFSSMPRQFHVVKESKTWLEAQRYCRENFVDLATIDDMAEIEKITIAMQNADVVLVEVGAWIGLKNGNSVKWRWSEDRALHRDNEPEFRNWAEGQPDNIPVMEECVAMNGRGGWHNYNCLDSRRFVCCNGRDTFALVQERKNWLDAQRYCRERYTDLASVRNEIENLIVNHVRGPADGHDEDTWIGLFTDSWEWSDGSNSSFRHWYSGEPNYANENGDCAEMFLSGQWNDESCNQHKIFICSDVMVRRTQMVRVHLEAEPHVDVNDPMVQAAFLQQIGQRQKEKGLPANTKLSWSKQPDGKVFHKEKNGKKKKKKRDEL
ncbi:macrophage mannose receptor 1-like [Engraulis encrasicolus]|uniref:macrophage mannose receptor 1-like n=1 Tax=Engraulis encrasicolus TaxID=184585 RepID=UPI002FD0C633